MPTPNCASLANYESLKQYATILEEETSFVIEELEKCKVEICSALWGIGNPDIAGAGVSSCTNQLQTNNSEYEKNNDKMI